jgi:hypothetical protein
MIGPVWHYQVQLVEVANEHYDSDNQGDLGKKNEYHAHILIHSIERPQQAYNLNLGSIYADRSDYEVVQGFEINFSDGCVCLRTYRVNEATEGILCDDDLINYNEY